MDRLQIMFKAKSTVRVYAHINIYVYLPMYV